MLVGMRGFGILIKSTILAYAQVWVWQGCGQMVCTTHALRSATHCPSHYSLRRHITELTLLLAQHMAAPPVGTKSIPVSYTLPPSIKSPIKLSGLKGCARHSLTSISPAPLVSEVPGLTLLPLSIGWYP